MSRITRRGEFIHIDGAPIAFLSGDEPEKVFLSVECSVRLTPEEVCELGVHLLAVADMAAEHPIG